MSRSSFGFRRSFNGGRKLSRENRKDINSQPHISDATGHNDIHEKRQRSRHDNSESDKATRSIFGDVPLTDTERRYLWAAQSGNLPALEMLVEEAGTFNLSCRDYLGRTALQLAVLGEHYDCIQLLLEKSRLDVIEEGLLHAIKTENVKICDMFLSHPVYSDQKSRMQLDFQHGFYEQEDSSSSFAPDITPIVLAAQCNNFDIVHMLIQKGFTIPTPHNYFCLCTECYNHKNFDRVVHSKSRLNAYRGLASTAYLSLSCDDPIYAAFELSRSLQKLAEREKEHKNEYRGLSDKCKNFAVDLLDQCRTNDEVMAALHGGTDTRDLSRIKMAIRYEQKKFIAHASCQEHLASMWYAGAPWFQHQNFPIKLILVPFGIVFIPVTAIVYVFLPYSRIGKILKSPFMKFMNYICSYTAFLVLLFLGTQLSSFKSVHLFNGTEGVVNGLIMFYVLGMFWAECKQLWEEGVRGYFSQMWNYMDITMLALYTAGYSTEGVIYTKAKGYVSDNNLIHSMDETILNPQILSKILFSVANVLSFARIAYILPASETFGQLQISYGRMLQDVGKFIFIYFTVMIAFICGLTSLYSISRNEHFSGLSQTTGTLFWAAFGMGNSKAPQIEDDPEDESEDKNEDGTLTNGQGEVTDSEMLEMVQVVGFILYGVYILGAVVVLINMLIAMMSNTFEDIQKSEDSEWKFARAKLWISFIEQGTTLPIPFNIIPTPKSIVRLFHFLRHCVCCEVMNYDLDEEFGQKYEMEYKVNVVKSIMHRVVLRFIHKMKFEKKGESLKDEILDTREEVIYQLHSMFGRLAARLELLEKDMFTLSKSGLTRNGANSPIRSSLSYSRSVPSHPRDMTNSMSRLADPDQSRESYLFRRRSYYHERPKKSDFLDGRSSINERLRKKSGDGGDVISGKPSVCKHEDHENEMNMSDGEKRSRKASNSHSSTLSINNTSVISSDPIMSNTIAPNMPSGGTSLNSGERSRKESVVSNSSQAHSDNDDFIFGRKDSYRMRSSYDGGFSPRPGGDRSSRDDSLRGSRKRDGFTSNPRWNQGVIKESSLEDQSSNNGDKDTPLGVRKNTGLRNSTGNSKRRETFNHPNIDAPFGLPQSETGSHTTNFTEYREEKPRKREAAIQNLVLDVHQMPFARIETGPLQRPGQPSDVNDTLSPTRVETRKRNPSNQSSSPASADAKDAAKMFNFSFYGKNHNGNNTNGKKSNSKNSSNNSNNDSDSEDQYAIKLSSASYQHKNRMYTPNPSSSHKARKYSDSELEVEHHSGPTHSINDPLSLAETECSQPKRGPTSGRRVGQVNHFYVPESQQLKSSSDSSPNEESSRTPHDKKSDGRDDTIFFTSLSREEPSQSLGSTLDYSPLSTDRTSKDNIPRSSASYSRHLTNSPRNVTNDTLHVSRQAQNGSNDSRGPLTYCKDGDESIPAYYSPPPVTANLVPDREYLTPVGIGYLNPSMVREEEEYFSDTRDSSPNMESPKEEMVRHYSDCSPYQRNVHFRKRESLPVIGLPNKHHRLLHMGREPRSRFSIPALDFTPAVSSSPSRYQQHYPVNDNSEIISDHGMSPDYDVIPTPMIIPPMATNLLPFPIPTQHNDVFAQRQTSAQSNTGESDRGAASDNEKETPRRKKTSLASLVRGRRSDKNKGKQTDIKHNRSFSLHRFGGPRGERKTLQAQRSKEV